MKAKLRSTSEIITVDEKTILRATSNATLHPIKRSASTCAALLQPEVEVQLRKLALLCDASAKSPSVPVEFAAVDWPVDILYDPDSMEFSGIVVPCVAGDATLSDLINPTVRAKKHPGMSYRTLYRAAQSLAGSIDEIHSRGCVAGGLDTGDIFVSNWSSVAVTGSFQFQLIDPKNGETLRCTPILDESSAPELRRMVEQKETLTAAQDSFWLAIVLFRLLVNGVHPFSGALAGDSLPSTMAARMAICCYPYDLDPELFTPVRSSPDLDVLTPALREMFVRCFTIGCTQPESRPTAAEWVAVLAPAHDEFKSCSVNELHAYNPLAQDCPWCALSARLGGAELFPPVEIVQEERHQAAEASASSIHGSEAAVATTDVAAAADTKTIDMKRLAIGAGIVLLIVVAIAGALNLNWTNEVSSKLKSAASSLATVEYTDPASSDYGTLLASAQQDLDAAQPALSTLLSQPYSGSADSLTVQLSNLQDKAAACESVRRASIKLAIVSGALNAEQANAAEPSEAQLLAECTTIENNCLRATVKDPALAGAWIEAIRASRLAGQNLQTQELTAQALAKCPAKATIASALQSL